GAEHSKEGARGRGSAGARRRARVVRLRAALAAERPQAAQPARRAARQRAAGHRPGERGADRAAVRARGRGRRARGRRRRDARGGARAEGQVPVGAGGDHHAARRRAGDRLRERGPRAARRLPAEHRRAADALAPRAARRPRAAAARQPGLLLLRVPDPEPRRARDARPHPREGRRARRGAARPAGAAEAL
ncbi:MAG: hypothetical protein AVDCRST_MAG11-3769, partial [uncultured Gemmatimonadaceae bacterium]